MITREDVQNKILTLLTQLSSDWEFGGEISTDMYFFSELGFQSLDAVVLGNTLQEQYGKPIPYAELLADIGQRTFNDITVGEWIDYTYLHLTNGVEGER